MSPLFLSPLPLPLPATLQWGMCVSELANNNIGGCNAMDQPSYIIYGPTTPADATLKSTPMMTSAQINASVAALNMSTITLDRLQVGLGFRASVYLCLPCQAIRWPDFTRAWQCTLARA